MKHFWHSNAYRNMIETLACDIPREGKVTDKTRPVLEDWRKVQNAYYRVYNDGDPWRGKLRHIAKRYGMESLWGSYDELELIAHRVFRAALNEYERAHGTLINQAVVDWSANK